MTRKEMTRRERVMDSLNFGDSCAIDLGGMLSTGISCFAYPKLRRFLGLPELAPRVHDVYQMLALPDRDVLDRLNCDVAAVFRDQWTNAFDEPERWMPYDFGGRLRACVQNPSLFRKEGDSLLYKKDGILLKMVPSSFVFDNARGDESVDIMMLDPPKEELEELERELQAQLLTDDEVVSIREYCRRARNSTDRAILFNGVPMGLKYRGGLASWSMFCLTDPDYVLEVHELITKYSLENYKRLIPEIADYVDIFMSNSDDQGTQNAPILPPRTFGELYVPFYRRMNDEIHSHAPGLKTFLHSCGAIYNLLDHIIDSGFDVLNPVQWSAGGHSYMEWKDRCRNRIALWGGGINSQVTLPLGTEEEQIAEVNEVCDYLKRDGGFVFNSIHNILAEIEPAAVVRIYDTAYANMFG